MIYGLGADLNLARTMGFSVLALSQLFHSLNCRSQTRSFFALGPLSNPWLILAFFGSIAIHMGVIYLPFAQKIFKTVALNPSDWLLMLAISALPFAVMEIYKFVRAVVKRIRREEDGYFGVFPE
jgi:Ca2+-transporting ATPase